MESTSKLTDIYQAVREHLKYDLRSRAGRLTALAKKNFPDRTNR